MSALAGKRIVVTRARAQATPLIERIRAQGGIAIAYPCLEIAPATDSRPLDAALRRLSDYDWLILTSGNAARALAQRLAALQLAPDWSDIKIAVVGPATAAELRRQLALGVDFMPAAFNAAALARTLPVSGLCRALLPQSDLADASAAQILGSRGVAVQAVSAYRAVCGQGGADVPALLARGEIDALTFFSPSAVIFFRQRCQSRAALALPAACIGQATARAARANGFQTIITARQPSLSGLLAALAASFADG